MTSVVAGIARPNEAVIGHVIPFFARDFASLAADAHSWIGKEANLNMIAHERVLPLVRAVCAFANNEKNQIRKAGTQEDRAEEHPVIRAK
jgi:hypothetical protein